MSAKGPVIAMAQEVTDRDEAELMRGLELFISRDALPPVANDEVYHTDLIGLDARGIDGEAIGVIVGLHDFGAGEIVEISMAGSSTTELYPFYPPFLVDLDIQEGKIVLAAQPASDDKGPDNRVDDDDRSITC